MGERSKCLSPDDTEIASALVADFREDAVEYITQHMHAQTCDDGLTTQVAVEC